jgi:hypothetical protein
MLSTGKFLSSFELAGLFNRKENWGNALLIVISYDLAIRDHIKRRLLYLKQLFINSQ